jgi:hypothetical protein
MPRKFRFYHVSLYDGMVYGFDDPQEAEDWRGSEDDFIIDTETGLWLTGTAEREDTTIQTREEVRVANKARIKESLQGS